MVEYLPENIEDFVKGEGVVKKYAFRVNENLLAKVYAKREDEVISFLAQIDYIADGKSNEFRLLLGEYYPEGANLDLLNELIEARSEYSGKVDYQNIHETTLEGLFNVKFFEKVSKDKDADWVEEYDVPKEKAPSALVHNGVEYNGRGAANLAVLHFIAENELHRKGAKEFSYFPVKTTKQNVTRFAKKIKKPALFKVEVNTSNNGTLIWDKYAFIVPGAVLRKDFFRKAQVKSAEISRSGRVRLRDIMSRPLYDAERVTKCMTEMYYLGSELESKSGDEDVFI